MRRTSWGGLVAFPIDGRRENPRAGPDILEIDLRIELAQHGRRAVKTLAQGLERRLIAQPGEIGTFIDASRQRLETRCRILGRGDIGLHQGTNRGRCCPSQLLKRWTIQFSGGREIAGFLEPEKGLCGVLAPMAIQHAGREAGAIEQDLSSQDRRATACLQGQLDMLKLHTLRMDLAEILDRLDDGNLAR